MKQGLLIFFGIIFCLGVKAQTTGDTIVVNTFNYSSTTRDTVINFPNNSAIPYEKVFMLYNIRCKNGLVSPAIAGQTNIGCGEWDYSCNTYLIDSSKVDSLFTSKVSHTISNFSGSTFPYITVPYFNLYKFTQTGTTATIVSENQHIVGTGSLSLSHVLDAAKRSGRSQYLFTQTELSAAGVTTGNIAGILLEALNSSTVNFLKIKMKHTSLTNLDASSPVVSGFTEVYYANTNFVTGSNRLQFSAPFNWDGISNIIIDFSFTNSTPFPLLNLVGNTTTNISGLYANEGAYINTGNGIAAAAPTAPFSSINNQITVAFWSRGNTGAATKNSSIIEGSDSAMRRQLNIHLPWGNSRVYFDCGNNGSSYDRIDTAASTGVLENVWNHWAFTKNTTTGIMKMYLNGALYLTGTGKVFPINIDSLIFGANINLGNQFNGDIDELSIWNAELSAANILAWKNKAITASHPNYANLVAYYKLDEGAGNNTSDGSTNSQTANFPFTPDWKFTRGENITRLFTETNERPNTIFLQGNYGLVNVPLVAYDSLPASGNIVKAYSVTSNAGTMLNDVVNLLSTNVYWYANYRYIYDGITGAKLDSLAVTPTATINVINYPYYDRFPSKYEMMSFVTPYGINLDLGMSGKTWTFDVTDFLPILKGPKRITVERGGQWQENMDIKFVYIVGTPVRDVKSITQIWRQPNDCNYNDIVTDRYFEPRSLLMDPTGKSFKIRNMITGHGQEGEFIPREHSLNIGGGANEFVWQVYKKCASNPVYPQGGTWIYDRCGWCPGMASDLKEFDITPYVTPGSFANIDYGMIPTSSPAIGDSRYIVTNQLVTYGDLNFALDASVIDIIAPTNKVEHAREQSICKNPKIMIQNTGSTALTSLTIEYWINNNTSSKSSFAWSGNLSPLEKAEVELPYNNLWVNVNAPDNDFHVEIKNPNGAADQYVYNNKMNSQFKITDVVPSTFVVYYRSNGKPWETDYALYDEWGNQLLSKIGANLDSNTVFRDTMHLTYGCYKFVMTDNDEDGISFYNNNDGNGAVKFTKTNATGSTIKTFNPDFGASFTYNFTVDFPLTYEQLYESNTVKLYPNPASDKFTIEAEGVENAKVVLNNSVGQKVEAPYTSSKGKLVFNTLRLTKGIYFVTLSIGDKTTTHKVVVE